MSAEPRVSVCIPSYNHAQYLSASIDSVLAQTFNDFELIIVDDGSTDGSLAIAQSYASSHPERVSVHTHPGGANRGISETVNLAYSLTRGEFWMGLPSDDVLYPDKIELQVSYLNEHPNAGWVYSYSDWIDEAGQPRPEKGLFGTDVTSSPNPLHMQIEGNRIPGMTVLMRRSCTDRVGSHEPGIVYSDWEFWSRMLAQCEAGFIPRPLTHCRVHSYNTSGTDDAVENLRRGRQVMQSVQAKASRIGGELSRPRTLALLEMQLAYFDFSLGQKESARLHLDAAFEVDRQLATDDAYFVSWFKRRVFELYHSFPLSSLETEFATWIVQSLPRAATRRLVRRATAVQLAALVLRERASNSQASLRYVLGCFAKDASWLADGSLRLAAIESVIGTKLTAAVRRMKLQLQPRGEGKSSVSL